MVYSSPDSGANVMVNTKQITSDISNKSGHLADYPSYFGIIHVYLTIRSQILVLLNGCLVSGQLHFVGSAISCFVIFPWEKLFQSVVDGAKQGNFSGPS